MKRILYIVLLLLIASSVFGQNLRTTTDRDAYFKVRAISDTTGLKECSSDSTGDVVYVEEIAEGVGSQSGGTFVYVDSAYIENSGVAFGAGINGYQWARETYLENDVVQVDWFGTAGDGTTDDVAKIDKAFEFVIEHGGILEFANKTYFIDKGAITSIVLITGSDNLKIKGRGIGKTIIKNNDTGNTYYFAFQDCDNVTISDMTFEHNVDKAGEAAGIYAADGCTNFTIERIKFVNTQLTLVDSISSFNINDCIFKGRSDQPISLNSAWHLNFNNIQFKDIDGMCMVLDGVNYSTFNNISADSCKLLGKMVSDESSSIGNTLSNITFHSKASATASSESALFATYKGASEDFYGHTISNLIIESNAVDAQLNYGLYLGSSSNDIELNNVKVRYHKRALLISGNSTDIRISNSSFSSLVGEEALWMEDATDISFTNCIFKHVLSSSKVSSFGDNTNPVFDISFTNCTWSSDSTTQELTRFYAGCKRVNVSNSFFKNGTNALQFLGDGLKATGNEFDSNKGTSIGVSGNSGVISNNKIQKAGALGIKLRGEHIIVSSNNIFDDSSTVVTEYFVASDSDSVMIYGNYFGDRYNTGVLNVPTTTRLIFGNEEYITENHGSATLANGTTSIAVTHGLSFTPDSTQIMATPTSAWGAMTEFSVGFCTSTQFTITADQDPTADVTFGWRASRQ